MDKILIKYHKSSTPGNLVYEYIRVWVCVCAQSFQIIPRQITKESEFPHLFVNIFFENIQSYYSKKIIGLRDLFFNTMQKSNIVNMQITSLRKI